MQGLDYGLVDNAALLSRIAELEHERDELRRNAEQATALQTGIFGGLDLVSRIQGSNLVSRIQGRRASGLEQELATCEQKLNMCQKENIKLQEELSEAYTIKRKFADLLKAEVEKSTGLEKEVKYFQNQAAAALSDRDRSLSEIERLQRKKDGLIEKITELQDRLDHVTSEYAEEKSLCEVLYSKLEKLKEENNLHKKVAERFWRVREQVRKTVDAEHVQDRASILLQDPEGFWSYRETNARLYNNQARQVKDDQNLQVYCTSMTNLPVDVQKESCARKQGENALSCCRQQLFCLTELVQKELQQLRLFERSLKEDVSLFFLEEKDSISVLQEALHLVVNVECTQTKASNFNNADKSNSNIVQIDQEEMSEADTKFSCSRATSENEETASVSDFMEIGLDKSEGVSGISEKKGESAGSFQAGELVRGTLEDSYLQGHEAKSRGLAMSNESLPSIDDGKVLAQALQEKVAALLLLSQQEERHILESNTSFAMESQIAFLKQQLLQVTTEKMDALVKLACSQEKCLKLQEEEKTFKKIIQHNRSGHLRSVAERDVPSNDGKNLLSFASKKASIGYLKHLWPTQGLGIHTKSLSHLLSLNRGKEDDGLSIARLRAENTSLQESLSCIGHLCKSINRLRQTIDRIAVQSNAQTESFFKSAAEEVDGVISEALHLKVVFKKSPTHNDLGWDSIGSPLTGAREMTFQEGSDGETNDDLDIVSIFGLEIVRLVLLAAQLQKRLLRHAQQ